MKRFRVPLTPLGTFIPGGLGTSLEVYRDNNNLVPRVFSAFNMAAGLEKTLAHSELKRSLIGAFLT